MNQSLRVAKNCINSIIQHAAFTASVLDKVSDFIQTQKDQDDYVVSLIEDFETNTILIARKSITTSIFLEIDSSNINEIRWKSLSSKKNGVSRIEEIFVVIEEAMF